MGDDTVYDDLVQFATNPSYGIGRQMVVLGLGTSKRPAVVDVLIGLLDGPGATWVRNVANKGSRQARRPHLTR